MHGLPHRFQDQLTYIHNPHRQFGFSDGGDQHLFALLTGRNNNGCSGGLDFLDSEPGYFRRNIGINALQVAAAAAAERLSWWCASSTKLTPGMLLIISRGAS